MTGVKFLKRVPHGSLYAILQDTHTRLRNLETSTSVLPSTTSTTGTSSETTTTGDGYVAYAVVNTDVSAGFVYTETAEPAIWRYELPDGPALKATGLWVDRASLTYI